MGVIKSLEKTSLKLELMEINPQKLSFCGFPIDFISEDTSIHPFLIEKDYWIMHSLYSLRKMEFSFDLKGGISLSKGFNIIDRFSEDIDIRIEPPVEQNVSVNPKQQRIHFFASIDIMFASAICFGDSNSRLMPSSQWTYRHYHRADEKGE